MASTAALDASKANRRFIILAVVLGLIGAVLIYMVLNRDTSSGSQAAVGGDTSVVVAKIDIPARTMVTADMLTVKLVPEADVSELAFADPTQVVGQFTRFAISANEHVLASKVVDASGSAGFSRALAYTIPEGKRALAISASEISQAGGLILPGDYIDILAVYNIEFGEKTEDAWLVQTLMQNIEVLAISQTIVDTVGTTETDSTSGQRPRNSEAKPLPDASTITLLVTPEQAQQLFLAERNAELRMSLRAFGDGDEKPIEFLAEPDLLPDNIPAPVR